MPANKKYLSSSGKRFSKVTAAILGGYIATMLLHIAIAKNLINDTPLLMTTAYSGFLIWIVFMLFAFLIDKAWHVWLLYTSLSCISLALIFI